MPKKHTSKTSPKRAPAKGPNRKGGPGRPEISKTQEDEAARRVASGESLRAVAADYGISHQALGRRLAAREAAGQHSGRRKREDHRSKRPQSPEPSDPGPVVVTAEDGDPRASLVALVAKTRVLRIAAEVAGNSLAFCRLAKLQAELCEQIDELDARQPPDPKLDPANTKARDTVRRLLKLTLEGGDLAVPPERDEAEGGV